MKLNFNAQTVDPSSSFDPIPAGWYTVEITDSIEKDTKSGNGSYLELTFKVIEGDYTGRLIWTRLNLNNPNTTTVEIAQKDLSAICHATGVLNLTDSNELHGKPLKVKATVRKSEEYGDSNEIKAYEALANRPVAAVAASTNSGGDKPWNK